MKYQNIYKGINSRLDEIQAALLSVKLKYLDAETAARRKAASFYLNNIKNPKIVLPTQHFPEGHVWHVFTVRVSDRVAFQQYLKSKHVETNIHYPVPPHQQPAYKELAGVSCPVSEQIHNEIISIPLSPVLSQAELQTVVDTLNSY